MAGEPQARTFISYSRMDGAAFAAELRKWLEKQNLSVWQDLVALEGGRDWWSQIEDALKSKALQHFILIITPGALDSPFVRREIRLARQQGKTVCPVKGPGLGNLGSLPRWLGQLYDLDLVEHKTTLIRVLQGESRQKRVPMMAPQPPEDFIQRPAEFDSLRRRLLDAKGDSVPAITIALRGAGGYGKTTLAKALAHNPDIQDAYFDGILWSELGKTPQLPSILNDLIISLTGDAPKKFETEIGLMAALGEALGDRRILLIIDDAHHERDLRFLQGGANTVRLLTTRIDSVLPNTAVRQRIDAMQIGEALDLLGNGLPPDEVSRESQSLRTLATRLGAWPLLLKIVNGFLRHRVVNTQQSVGEAIAGANKRLDAKGLVAFDPREEIDRAKAVAHTIAASLELLTELERSRFAELSVFPEEIEVPISIVEGWWAATGGLVDFESEDLLTRLFDLSLLQTLDLGERTFRLHDMVRHFLRDQAGKEGLAAQHKQFVAALDAMLLNPSWLLRLRGREFLLVGEYERHGLSEAQDLISQRLRLLDRYAGDERQLMPQLIEGLAGHEAFARSQVLQDLRRFVPRPAIVPFRPKTLVWDNVHMLCPLPDGGLASCDTTIRLWDVTTWAEIGRLGRLGGVLQDIRFLDVRTCVEIDRLRYPGGRRFFVTALCALPEGRLASSFRDQTIRLWDIANGTEICRIQAGRIMALCAVPDGRLVSGSVDHMIQLWDIATGVETARLGAPTGHLVGLCMLPDGRLASSHFPDNTIRLWDLKTGAVTRLLSGHSGTIAALCMLPDGRLVSGSYDNTIRIWDVVTGAEAARLEVTNVDRPASGGVKALCLLPDGRLISASADNWIRLWDVATGTEMARLNLGFPIRAVAAVKPKLIVVGIEFGMHWLEVLD